MEQSTVKDSNGDIPNDGDSVTLIKSLKVKGGGVTLKQGTLVKKGYALPIMMRKLMA